MNYHRAAAYWAYMNTREEAQVADRIVRGLRDAGVDVLTHVDVPGRPVHKVLRELAQRDRLVFLASDASLRDPSASHLLGLVEEREAILGGASLVVPVAVGVDVPAWLRAQRVTPDSPLRILESRVALRSDDPRLIPRLLKALEMS